MLQAIIADRNRDPIITLPSVILYLNSKVSKTIDTTTDFVWRNIKGNGAVDFRQVLALDTLRPSYDTASETVVFNNTDVLNASVNLSTSTARSFSITCVVQKAWGGGDFFFLGRDSAVGGVESQFRMNFQYNRLNIQQGAAVTYTFNNIITTFGAGSTDLCVCTIRADGTNLFLRINGLNHPTSFVSAWTERLFVKYIGSDPNANKVYTGKFGGIVINDKASTNEELALIENKLAKDFNITF